MLYIFKTSKENFNGILDQSQPTGSITPKTQNTKQIIAELLKENPNRYDDFFGRFNINSDKANKKYPLIWPLTTGNLDSRLAFLPTYQDGSKYVRRLTVTDKPPSNGILWFTGNPFVAPVYYQASQLRVYDIETPDNPYNYLGAWVNGLSESNPKDVPNIGGSCTFG